MAIDIYSDPSYAMATEQFRIIADYLQIDDNDRQRMLHPKRAMAVSLPVRMTNGEVRSFQGYRVQHHLTLGPTKGGTRFHPAVTLGEVAALAMWMSWKCALTGLPYGGAKGGVTVEPGSLSIRELEAVSRQLHAGDDSFRRPAHRHHGAGTWDKRTGDVVVHGYLLGASGLRGAGDRDGQTGLRRRHGRASRGHWSRRGVSDRTRAECAKMQPDKCTAVIQGFGNVGSVTALGLAYKSGMKVIGLSDQFEPTTGRRDRRKGADDYARKTGSLQGFDGATPIPPEDLLTLKCDVLVPAAVEAVITEHNAGRLQCRILAEGANGPTTPAADRILFERWAEIFVIPDILCNAGGVIVIYFEWVQGLQAFLWNETEVMDRLFRDS